MNPTPPEPEPTDVAQQQLRRSRGALFDNLFGPPGYSTAQPLENSDPKAPPPLTTHQVRPVGELPAAFADSIIIGQIKAVQAYQSNNHTAIYTESTIWVERVLSQQGNHAVAGGNIVFDQVGGSIALPGGRVLSHLSLGLGAPFQLGERYAFSLTYVPSAQCYQLTKAWWLTAGKAQAISSEDMALVRNGTSQYNEPPALVVVRFGQSSAVAWPQAYTVYYVEYAGIYDNYETYFPSDYQTAITTAYSNYGGADNNSLLDFEYWGTTADGLDSIGANGNPDCQPWHQWIIVNQAALPANVAADTSAAWQNYGSKESPYWAVGTANSRVSNAMSLGGDDVSYSASAFAHELGHTLALADCYNCQGGSNGTIMTAAQSLLAHASYNITGPQYCDNRQTLQTAYYPF